MYRVRDDSLVIAVDDVPDNGLDVPLRLEKLANKVTYTRMNAALQVQGGLSKCSGGLTTVQIRTLCDEHM